jgi:hypothetical protein
MSTRPWTAADGMRLEIHWYENLANALRVEFKSKAWW